MPCKLHEKPKGDQAHSKRARRRGYQEPTDRHFENEKEGMKRLDNLTGKEILDTPPKVSLVFSMAQLGIPIGIKFYEGILNEYPEYFPEEVEWRRKMALVPESVHEAYRNELHELFNESFKEWGGRGMLYWTKNPEEYAQTLKKAEASSKKQRIKEDELFKKYYSAYGLER